MKFLNFSQYKEYNRTVLPGYKEEISGTIMGGYNLGVVNNLKSNKKEAVKQFLHYLTSKETHKKFIIMGEFFSPVPSYYDDEEVCSHLNCQLYKNFQYVRRPFNLLKGNEYDDYSYKFRNYIYDYLYGNDITASEALTNVINILKIHTISPFNFEETKVGLIFFIIQLVILIVLITSFAIPLLNTFQWYFKQFSYSYWVIFLIGSLALLTLSLSEYNEVTKFKCQLKPFLLLVGNFSNLYPFVDALIMNYPKDSRSSTWINRHRELVVMFYLLANLILILTSLSLSWTVEKVIVNDAYNFNYCMKKNIFNEVLEHILYGFTIIKELLILLFIFYLWDVEETFIEIKMLSSAIYSQILLYLIFNIMNYIKIKINTYYFVVYEMIYILFLLSNYVFLYSLRIVFTYTRKKRNFQTSNNNNNNIKSHSNSKSNQSNSKIRYFYYESTIESPEPSNVLNDFLIKNQLIGDTNSDKDNISSNLTNLNNKTNNSYAISSIKL